MFMNTRRIYLCSPMMRFFTFPEYISIMWWRMSKRIFNTKIKLEIFTSKDFFMFSRLKSLRVRISIKRKSFKNSYCYSINTKLKDFQDLISLWRSIWVCWKIDNHSWLFWAHEGAFQPWNHSMEAFQLSGYQDVATMQLRVREISIAKRVLRNCSFHQHLKTT